MDPGKFSDVEVSGPGMWFLIHLEAVSATTNEKKRSYTERMEILEKNFKCLECKRHLRSFLDSNPLSRYWNVTENGKDVGFFKWSWQLHNDVNRRTGKAIVSFEDAYDYYSTPDVGICMDCGHEDVSKEVPPVSRPVPKILNMYLESKKVAPRPFLV